MKNINAVFKEIPLQLIERDPEQPRKDFGTDGDENRLWVSIRDLGIQQPLAVSERVTVSTLFSTVTAAISVLKN